MGAFSAFLSPERKSAFHRINMEYMQALSTQSLSDIATATWQGARLNSEILNINYKINGNLEEIAKYAYENHNAIRNTNEILSQILDTLKNPTAVSASEKARIASQNIVEAKSMKEERACKLLDEAIEYLEEAISISPVDYKAHFDLGWVYSFYKEDLNKAEQCFDNAVLRSIQKDKGFAVFALRHLADTRQMLGSRDAALEAIEEAVELQAGDVLQTKIEYAQHLINSEDHDKAKSVIKDVIQSYEQAFDVVYTDPIISGSKIISSALEDALQKQKEAVKESLKQSLKKSNLIPEPRDMVFEVIGDKKRFLGLGYHPYDERTYHKFTIPKEILESVNKNSRSLLGRFVSENIDEVSYKNLRSVNWINGEIIKPEEKRLQREFDNNWPYRSSSDFSEWDNYRNYDKNRNKAREEMQKKVAKLKDLWRPVSLNEELLEKAGKEGYRIIMKHIESNLDELIPAKLKKIRNAYIDGYLVGDALGKRGKKGTLPFFK
jgi:tetratricopeptide (TPR) repeat protein